MGSNIASSFDVLYSTHLTYVCHSVVFCLIWNVVKILFQLRTLKITVWTSEGGVFGLLVLCCDQGVVVYFIISDCNIMHAHVCVFFLWFLMDLSRFDM
jgi:hypothetical protein